MDINFSEMSADALDALAQRASTLATDLRTKQPTYELALANGVQDMSYRTVRFGRIASYWGTANITMDDGSRWVAIGHRPTGGPGWVSREGWIEFVPATEAVATAPRVSTDRVEIPGLRVIPLETLED